MKKRTTMLLAAVTALTCLCGTASTAANAEDMLVLTRDTEGHITVAIESSEDVPTVTEDEQSYTWTLPGGAVIQRATKGECGQLNYHEESYGAFWYIVTDGTELPLAHTFRMPSNAVYDENGNLLSPSTDRFVIDGTEVLPEDADYPTNAEEIFAECGEGAKLYRLSPGSLHSCYPNTKYTLIAENPHILNIYNGINVADGIASFGGLTLKTDYPNGAWDAIEQRFRETGQQPSQEEMEEIERLYLEHQREIFGDLYDEVQALNAEREEWVTAYSDWRCSIDYVNMTPAEREVSREEYGLTSEWDMFAKALDLKNRCEERWAEYRSEKGLENLAELDEVCTMGFVWSTFEDAAQTCKSESVWKNFMDADYNGVLDASDAANLLLTLSNSGANGTSCYDSRMDLNMDGALNASDAADLLQYLAKSGSGDAESIEDYAKQLHS